VPTSKAAVRKPRAAAARSELNGKLRTITLKTPPLDGVKVKIPPDLPPAFGWDLAEAHSLLRADDPLALGAFYDLLVSVVGREAVQELREALARQEAVPAVPAAPLVIALNDITAEYGIDEGES
jgi:hypothetical protein